MSRHKIEIDMDMVENFARAHCTCTSIASYFGVSFDTLQRRIKEHFNIDYAEFSRQKKEEGASLIKAKQFELAMAGEKSMLIWLGKQYCEQKDKMEQKLTTNDNEFKITVETTDQKNTIDKLRIK